MSHEGGTILLTRREWMDRAWQGICLLGAHICCGGNVRCLVRKERRGLVGVSGDHECEGRGRSLVRMAAHVCQKRYEGS